MIHLLPIVVVLVLLVMPEAVNAGIACYGACLQACLSAGVFAFANPLGIAVGITGCNTVCMVACATAAFVPPACFANDTTIAVPSRDSPGIFQQQQQQQQLISDIRPGDEVLTLVRGRPKTTRVIQNIHSTGNFEFFEFWVQMESDGSVSSIKVTPEHGMLLAVDNNDYGADFGQKTRLVFPADVRTGDQMRGADGLKATVTWIQRSIGKDRYTLVTAEGTVLASQLLVSTICENQVNKDHSVEDVLHVWRQKHQYNNIEARPAPICLTK